MEKERKHITLTLTVKTFHIMSKEGQEIILDDVLNKL